jgi:hypothetical protein
LSGSDRINDFLTRRFEFWEIIRHG